jgi:hypothetical protein
MIFRYKKRRIATALFSFIHISYIHFAKKNSQRLISEKVDFPHLKITTTSREGRLCFKSDSLFSGVYRFIFKAFVAGLTLEIFRKNDLLKKTKNYKMACLVADNLKRKGSHRLAAFSENDLVFS